MPTAPTPPTPAASGIRRSTLEGGARVVTESMPELRSAAIAIWVGSGARDEAPAIAGASHFLEHLLFKGSATHSALEIAQAIESVGGDMNAFTSHEATAFYVRVPDDRLELAVEILSDVVWSPAFRADEVEAERQVILEEIRMRDDVPDDVVHELFAASMFPDHPLGREVIGSKATISGMSRDEIARYHGAHYEQSNVVFAAAGNLQHDDVLALVQAGLPAAGERRPARPAMALTDPRPFAVVVRPTEQAHIVIGTRAMARDDDDRHAFGVMNQALGGGMSSRLFQEVRERRGLAYSVYSFRGAFEDTGSFGVYAGTAPERVAETVAVIGGELDRLLADGLTEEELVAAKGHLRGSLALSLESSASRMHRLGRSELTLGEVPTLDEMAARIDAVTAEDVARVTARVLGGPRTLVAVGPIDEAGLARAVAA